MVRVGGFEPPLNPLQYYDVEANFAQYPRGGLFMSIALHHFLMVVSLTLNLFPKCIDGTSHTNFSRTSLSGLLLNLKAACLKTAPMFEHVCEQYVKLWYIGNSQTAHLTHPLCIRSTCLPIGLNSYLESHL